MSVTKLVATLAVTLSSTELLGSRRSPNKTFNLYLQTEINKRHLTLIGYKQINKQRAAGVILVQVIAHVVYSSSAKYMITKIS